MSLHDELMNAKWALDTGEFVRRTYGCGAGALSEYVSWECAYCHVTSRPHYTWCAWDEQRRALDRALAAVEEARESEVAA